MTPSDKQDKIASISSKICYPVLNYALNKKDLSRGNRVLLYLYINGVASKEQLANLCCYKGENIKAFTVILNRLSHKSQIEKYVADNEDNKITLYYLSKKSVNNISSVFCEIFKEGIVSNSRLKELYEFLCNGETVNIDDCCKYLSDRNEKVSFSKKYLTHTLGARDVPLAFLSNVGYSSPYSFSCFHEVDFDAAGEPKLVELFRKGMESHKGEVRSDAALSFYIGNNYGNPLNFYIEHDTGSQGSAVLREKIRKYKEHVFLPLLNRKVSEVPYLVFSHSGISGEEEEIVTSDFTMKERYLAMGVSLAASIYMSMQEECYGFSLYEFREYVSSIALTNRDASSFMPFIDKCIEQLGGEKNTIDLIEKINAVPRTYSTSREDMIMRRHEIHFNNRRNLLFNAIDEQEGIEDLFLAGASICAVSNLRSSAARTFLPECIGVSAFLSQFFSSPSGKVGATSLRATFPFSLPDGKGITLRNVYTLSDGRQVCVENIGDDYGAYHRVKYLLENNFAPCEILCIFSNTDTERIRALFQKHKGKSCLVRYHVMNYVIREDEYKGERDSLYSYDSVVPSPIVNAIALL